MKAATFESSLLHEWGSGTNEQSSDNSGWQKVVSKRQRKPSSKQSSDAGGSRLNGALPAAPSPNVFLELEQQAEDRRLRVIEAQKASAADAEAPLTRSTQHTDDEGDSDDEAAAGGPESGKADESKPKKLKKQKKPKITLAEAASKIDAADLAIFMADVLASYETQQEIQLMRFADYFGRAFSAVNSSQFPWTKMFRESPLAKIVDIPLSHISEAVYKTSVDWISLRSHEALVSFVLWSLDSILTDLTSHQSISKGAKKGAQQASSKSQGAIFVVLAMVLRRKPDVLVSLLLTLRENPKYQGQDKLPVILWMIAQACQGDVAVGVLCWGYHLLPLAGVKTTNSHARDLILQLVERALSSPKARSILLNGAVWKGERLVPPSAFETLMRITFPAPSARAKETARFEALYPTLKEIALAGVPGSKAMKQVSQQLMSFAVKAAAERIPDLSSEATGIFVWCLNQSSDCYKQWDKIYLDNVEASIAVLKRLCEESREKSTEQSSMDAMRKTLKGFRHKNMNAVGASRDAASEVLLKDADRYCKIILGRLSCGRVCVKGMTVAVIALAVGVAIMSLSIESWDWNSLLVMFSSYQS